MIAWVIYVFGRGRHPRYIAETDQGWPYMTSLKEARIYPSKRIAIAHRDAFNKQRFDKRFHVQKVKITPC